MRQAQACNMRSNCRCSCVLQFTLSHAFSCVLHRPPSQLIHCMALYFYIVFFSLEKNIYSVQPFHCVSVSQDPWLCTQRHTHAGSHDKKLERAAPTPNRAEETPISCRFLSGRSQQPTSRWYSFPMNSRELLSIRPTHETHTHRQNESGHIL